MWSPDALKRALTSLALGAVLVLGGCTLTPVHGDASAEHGTLSFTYGEPSTRLEQVFYREIASGLGRAGPSLGELSATITLTDTRIGLSNVSGPYTDHQIVANVTYSVIVGGAERTAGTRQASSGYRESGQIVADDAARTAAEEQAVRAVAHQVRLALIAEFAPR